MHRHRHKLVDGRTIAEIIVQDDALSERSRTGSGVPPITGERSKAQQAQAVEKPPKHTMFDSLLAESIRS